VCKTWESNKVLAKLYPSFSPGSTIRVEHPAKPSSPTSLRATTILAETHWIRLPGATSAATATSKSLNPPGSAKAVNTANAANDETRADDPASAPGGPGPETGILLPGACLRAVEGPAAHRDYFIDYRWWASWSRVAAAQRTLLGAVEVSGG